MTLYLCERWSGTPENYGTRLECFYREGASAKEVENGLDLFQYPEGFWVIREENDCEDED